MHHCMSSLFKLHLKIWILLEEMNTSYINFTYQSSKNRDINNRSEQVELVFMLWQRQSCCLHLYFSILFTYPTLCVGGCLSWRLEDSCSGFHGSMRWRPGSSSQPSQRDRGRDLVAQSLSAHTQRKAHTHTKCYMIHWSSQHSSTVRVAGQMVPMTYVWTCCCS